MKKRSKATKDSEIKVIILSGEKDAERAIFGLSYALTAASMGCKVTVFLAMDGAALANRNLEDKIIVKQYYSIPYYLNLLDEFEVKIVACSTCIENFSESSNAKKDVYKSFNVPSSFTKPKVLRQSVEVMGMTSLFSPTPEVKTVVF